MILHSFKSEGIILARRNFSEADRIIDIYTKDKGKLSFMAKGVRKPTSRKRGHVEIFERISFQAISGKGMPILTEVETLDDFRSIRKSINKISLAYYFVEVVGKITVESGENLDLYNFLVESFDNLKNGKNLKKLRFDFAENILKITGYWPKEKSISFPDEKLEEVMERQIYSKRVGKRVLE